MPLELVADGGADEVGAVRVEPLLHHQVDVAEVDVAEVDRDLFALAGLGSQLMHVACHASYHPQNIHLDGIWRLILSLTRCYPRRWERGCSAMPWSQRGSRRAT